MADLLGLLATVLVALGGLAGLLWRARRRGAADERARWERQNLENDAATRRRMDDAAAELDNDPDALRDWLRRRGRE